VHVDAGYAEGLEICGGVWLRRADRARGLALGWAGYVALMTWASVSLYLSDRGGGGELASAAFFFVAFVLPGLFAIWRCLTAGLLIGDEVVLIRGPVHTRRIPTGRILRFEPGVSRVVGNGTPCPGVRLADGSWVPIWALGREGVRWNFDRYVDEAAPLCEALDRLLEQVRGQFTAAPPPAPS
jgi:hypothetical protein